MNRIYQGKVTAVEIPGGKGEQGKPLDNWQDVLWHHHELYQDAVNYYTFAFAALGNGLPDKHPIKELRGRMLIAWEIFRERHHLHQKICAILFVLGLGCQTQPALKMLWKLFYLHHPNIGKFALSPLDYLQKKPEP